MQNTFKYFGEEYDLNPKDLEDQIGINKMYIIDLNIAYNNLRSISVYWIVAITICVHIATVIGFMVTHGSAVDWLIFEPHVSQTILTTILSLVICAAVFSFARLMSVRRLAAEANEVSEANRKAVQEACRVLEVSL